MSFLGLGGGDPSNPAGYGSLTPDQRNMVQQQGWYPAPDMVLPSGSTQQQMFPTQGYGNLTNAQAATVNNLGYYTNSGATQPDSLMSQISKALGSTQGQDALKKLQGAMQGPQPLSGATPPAGPPMQRPTMMNPYHNLYSRVSLDPQTALAALQRGY